MFEALFVARRHMTFMFNRARMSEIKSVNLEEGKLFAKANRPHFRDEIETTNTDHCAAWLNELNTRIGNNALNSAY